MGAVVHIDSGRAGVLAYKRARQLGYGPTVAGALRRTAERDRAWGEHPADTANRVVRPMHASAMRDGGGDAA